MGNDASVFSAAKTEFVKYEKIGSSCSSHDHVRATVFHGAICSLEVFINPRPAGGGAESAPLLVFQNNSTTVADIDTKFSVSYPTSI